MAEVKVVDKKSFLTSKTLWVSFLAFVAFVIQGFTGFVVSPEFQGAILAMIMFGLRFMTKQSVEV